MLCISFNQDSSCFAYGTNNGFVVYNSDPPTERFNRLNTKTGHSNGIGIVEMLYRSNIFALVGGGVQPKSSINTVLLWDDFQNKCIAELEFKGPITRVKLRRDIILISIPDKTYLYNFTDLQLIKSFETINNTQGIAALSYGANPVIAVAGSEIGQVVIDHYGKATTKIIQAHTTELSIIALNNDGDRLATASKKGTIIRIWDTITGNKLREFRRGVSLAEITGLIFDKDTTRIAITSKKGTVHIFSLQESTNKRSNLMYISDYLPQYFSSEWSAVSFTVPHNKVCTFGNSSDTIYVITEDGIYHKYIYDTTTGIAKCVETFNIVKI